MTSSYFFENGEGNEVTMAGGWILHTDSRVLETMGTGPTRANMVLTRWGQSPCSKRDHANFPEHLSRLNYVQGL